MVSVFLTFAGISLFINGMRIWLDTVGNPSNLLEGKDIAIVNLFTGFIGSTIVALLMAQGHGVPQYDYFGEAYIGLVSLTCVWIGINQFTGVNGTAVGWFSLVVPFFAIPAGVIGLRNSQSLFETWMALNWFAWAGLWFLFFLLFVLRCNIAKFTGAMTVAQSIMTAILPAILLHTKVI